MVPSHENKVDYFYMVSERRITSISKPESIYLAGQNKWFENNLQGIQRRKIYCAFPIKLGALYVVLYYITLI